MSLPAWPSTNWDVETMSHAASAVEAAGHRESGGCSGWETRPSVSLPVQLTHTFITGIHKQSGWMWRESPCVLTSVRGHRVPPVTDLSHTRKSVQEGVVWSLYWHPLSSHLLPGHSHANIFPGILAICDFVCLCQHQHNCYIKFHHCC